MSTVQWAAEAQESVAQVMYLRHNGGQWTSGLGLQAGGTPWGTGREAAQREKYLNDASAVLEALKPHVEKMIVQAQDAAVENIDVVDTYCEERHVSEEEADDLQRAAQHQHDMHHEGPWLFCSNGLCYAVREAVG